MIKNEESSNSQNTPSLIYKSKNIQGRYAHISVSSKGQSESRSQDKGTSSSNYPLIYDGSESKDNEYTRYRSGAQDLRERHFHELSAENDSKLARPLTQTIEIHHKDLASETLQVNLGGEVSFR